jgi:hypothetical protein
MTTDAKPYALDAAEGRPIDLGEGSVVAVKADEHQTGGVVSVLETQEPPRKLNFYFPASMIGYFDDLAAALRQQDVSADQLTEIATAYGMEIVGPPSERYV